MIPLPVTTLSRPTTHPAQPRLTDDTPDGRTVYRTIVRVKVRLAQAISPAA